MIFSQGSRKVGFKYNILNNEEVKIGEIDQVENATIEHGQFRKIKRSAIFKLKSKTIKDINYMQDRVQPVLKFFLANGTMLEFSLGIFLLDEPNKERSKNSIAVSLSGLDKLTILDESPITRPYIVKKNTNYIGAITKLLNESGITKINIKVSEKTLDRDVYFATGTKFLEAINQLLQEINYNTISADENGFLYSEPYKEPSERSVTKKYLANKTSIITPDLKIESGLAGRANVFIAEATNLDSEIQLPRAIYKNNNILSPTSIQNRGREIAGDVYQFEDVSDFQTLENKLRRIAIENMTSYSHLVFGSALIPHGGEETLLFYEPQTVDTPTVFYETSWSMELKLGGIMQHECRRVIKL